MVIRTRLATWLAGLALALGVAAAAQGPLDTVLTPQTAGPTVATVPITAAPTGTPELTKQDLTAWLDGFMPYALQSGDLAGAVFVVVKDGQVLTARGYGYADIAKKTPVDPYRTLFRPGSVSKLFTWTAVMQQVEAGKIDLDADVNRYLDFKIPPYHGRPITMRQIMTHTAGFEEAAKNDFLGSAKDIKPIGQFLKTWTPTRIYAPGTTPAYSNWATMLAGYVVERVSGVSFDDYVEQRIFAPLGMKYATFRQPLPASLAPYVATGYPRASEPAKPFENIQVTAAGSLSASGVDMARFMLSHLQGGRGLMRPDTAALMHDSPLDKVNPYSLIPPLNRMELGFFESNINGREVIGHLGDVENMHTSLHLFMNEGVGLYVSFNSSGKEGAAHTLRTALFEGFADRYFPSSQADGRVDAKTAAQHAQAMTGLWRGSRRAESSFLSLVYMLGQTQVTVGEDGELVIPDLKEPGGGVRQWVEIAPWVWRDRNGHDRLAAKVENGRVVRWSYDLAAPFTVFDRVPVGVASTWLKPALYLSLAVLALTFLYWPLTWFVRHRYEAQLGVSGGARQAYRATRIMAGLDLVVAIGWLVAVTVLFASATRLTDASNAVLWFLQITSAIVFVGAVGIAGWNLWVTVRDGRRWTRLVWNTLILLATLVVLYVAIRFNLIAMTVNY